MNYLVGKLFMKYRYLSIIVLILILSMGAVCAQEDAADADAVAADSEDILSVDNNVNMLENEISSGDSVSMENANVSGNDKLAGNINENVFDKNSDYDGESSGDYLISAELLGYGSVEDTLTLSRIEVNNDTFFEVFNETGYLRNNITADNLEFIGEFSDLVDKIIIDRSVTLSGDEALLYNIGIEILHDNVTVDDFSFICDSLSEVITIRESDNVSIIFCEFNVTGLADSNNTVIHIVDSDNVLIDIIELSFNVQSNATYKNTAISAEESDNLNISNSNIISFLPSRSIDSSTGMVYSKGVCLDNCNNALLDDDEVVVISNDKTSEYGTVYALHITGDDANVIYSRIGAGESPYGYALVISGENFNIYDNYLAAAENGTYAFAVNVESNSNGVIDSNEILVMGDSAYAIYTADWAGDVKVNITNNIINSTAITVFAMSLRGSEALVENNTVIANGNYTTGIASVVDDIEIKNNTINANGSNAGIREGSYVMSIETTGIHIVAGNALVTKNKIRANNKYAVDFEGEGEVTDNEIIADLLTGDFAVDYVQNTGVLVANNTPEMELNYTLTNDTFFIYFDEQGFIREQITADNLEFIGEFSDLVDKIIIDRSVTLSGDEALLYNIGIEILHDNVTVDDFSFICDSLSEVITIRESDNVSIIFCEFNVIGLADSNNTIVHIIDSDNVLFDVNEIHFEVESNGTYKNTLIYAEESDNLSVSNSEIIAYLPSHPVDWDNGVVYSEGIYLDNCNNAVLDDNWVATISNNETSEYGTIYTVHITGDNAILTYGRMAAIEAPYGYALVISGDNFTIHDNYFAVGENGTYACAINVEGNSSGVIDSNEILVIADSAYGIYTADWAGDVKTNITNNFINSTGITVFAMSLSGSEAVVDGNEIIANGNFTTGIASAVGEILINNNTILANGSNEGEYAGYDSMGIETVGVHVVKGNATVKENNITSNGEYTVSAEGTGAVTDNYLIANKYTGDASVNNTPDNTLVANNIPTMQRAIVSADNVVMYYKNGTRYVIQLTDQKGEVLSNKTVTITINGKSYNRTTDENGTASMPVNLPSGNYTASVLYVGKDNFTNTTSKNNITVLTTISGDDIVKIFRNATQYYATFIDAQGNPLADGTDVTFNINGVQYTRHVNGSEGKAKLNINLSPGEYIITATNSVNGEMHSNNITVLANIESKDLVKYFRNESQFVVTIFGEDGKPVGAGENVTFNVNGVLYTRQTNASGQAKLNINLAQGNHTITTTYNGCDVANNIEVLPILYAEDLIKVYGTSDQFRAKLFDAQGNPYAGQSITFNMYGVFYNETTDYDGWASLDIKSDTAPETYIITSMYGGCSISNEIIIKPA